MNRSQSGNRNARRAAVFAFALLAMPPFSALPSRAGGETKCSASDQVCIERVAAKMKASGWVGVELEVDEETGTYTVEKVIPGSPAAKAGIKPMDVLVEINGVPLSACKDTNLSETRRHWKPGQSVRYTIKRDRHDREIALTLATMPAEILARYIAMHIAEHDARVEPAP